jgi:APA family basic amino acid/polyamine antiporter
VSSTSESQPADAGPAAGLAAEHRGLFVRKSSGLVREIGLREAFGINISVLNPGISFIGILSGLALFPGADLTWPFVIAAVVVAFLALTYAQLVASMPRSGGDFVYITRILNPVLGAMVGGALLIEFLYIAGINSTIWGETYLPFFFSALGHALHVHAFIVFAGTLTEKGWSLGVAVAMIVGVTAIGLRGTRAIMRAIFGCFIVGMVGYAVMFVLFIIHSHSDFISAFNHFSNNGHAYSQLINKSHSLGLHTGIVTSAVLTVIPFMALQYWGFTFAIYPGAEVKRPGRTIKWSTLGALAVGMVMFLAAWLALRHLTSLTFLQSSTWLSANNSGAYGGITAAPASAAEYALVVSGDPVTKILLGLSFPAWNLLIMLAYVLATSRVLFALSFDRLLPTKVADVNPRTNSPVKALIIVAIGFIVFTAVGIYTSVDSGFRNVILISGGIYALVSLAGAVLPYVRRDLYDSGPKAFSGRWLGLPPITVIGTISCLCNLGLTYLAATKPQLSGGYSAASIVVLAVITFAGLVLYVVSQASMRRRGMSLGLAMQELPPD